MDKLRVVFFIAFVITVLRFSVIAQESTDIQLLNENLAQSDEDTSSVNMLLKLAANYSSGELKKAEQFAHLALELSNKLGYESGIAHANYEIARLFTYYDFRLAETFIVNAYDQAVSLGDSLLIARIRNLIGVIKYVSGDIDNSLRYHEQALDYFISNNLDSLAAGTYQNIANALSVLNKDSLAMEYFLKAVEINEKFANHHWLCINYINIGKQYNKIGRYDTALFYLQKSLTIAIENNFIMQLSLIYTNLGETYLHKGDLTNAILFAHTAYNHALKVNSRYDVKYSYMILSDIFFRQNIMDSAFYYLKKLNEINDSIYQSERTESLDLMEIKYKYQEELKINELNSKKKLVTLWLIIAVLTGMSITIYLLHRLILRKKQLENERLNREKQLLQKEIEIKSREVTFKLLQVANQNQLISKVIDSLSSIDQAIGDDQNKFQEVISELRLHQKFDLWEAFEKEFIQLHPDFFSNLTTAYPNLTQYELRLCAFLKLNMNSKEIADILHLNAESIMKARYRLRKKLNLSDPDESLNALMMKF